MHALRGARASVGGFAVVIATYPPDSPLAGLFWAFDREVGRAHMMGGPGSAVCGEVWGAGCVTPSRLRGVAPTDLRSDVDCDRCWSWRSDPWPS